MDYCLVLTASNIVYFIMYITDKKYFSPHFHWGNAPRHSPLMLNFGGCHYSSLHSIRAAMPTVIISATGRKRCWWLTIATTPARSASRCMSRASATLRAIGFSQRTCLPASSAAIVIPWCRCGGAATMTASISGFRQSER